nr:CAP domain-containing protein [Lysinibacillus timonensis]
MKKFLAGSVIAATLFGASFTSADAASLNKEVKVEANPQIIQMMKGDNYQAIAYQLIGNISLQNGQLDISKVKDLVNNTLNASDANKVIQALNTVERSTQNETTNKPVEKEVKTPQTPAKPATSNTTKTPTKQTAKPATSNTTKAPTNIQQVAAPTKTPTTNVNQSVSEFEKQVVDLTNAERAKAGLKPLEIYTPLMGVAQAKSEDMAKNNYFSHNSPTYGSPFDQIKAAGISYRAAGENIAQGQTTPAQVVQAWMDSPGHRANILNANYTHIGVGYVADGNYWTQQFIQL